MQRFGSLRATAQSPLWLRSLRAAFWVATVGLVLSLWPMPAIGQISDDPSIEVLRQRVPAGAADQQTVDRWLNKLMESFKSAPDARLARGDFLTRLSQVRQAPDTTTEFNDLLASRLGELAKTELEQDASLPARVSEALVRSLHDANDPGTLPGLLSGLQSSQRSTRFLAVAAIGDLRATIARDVNMAKTVVTALEAVGRQESSGPIVERIYRALSFATMTNDSFNALMATLQSRVDRYRNGADLVTEAEVILFDYLSATTLTQAQRVRLMGLLAVLLRLDVERYAQPILQPHHRLAIEKRVDATESLIERICSCQGGSVRETMQGGGVGVEIQIQLELDEWIGSEQSQGVLNQAPWNVPRRAP